MLRSTSESEGGATELHRADGAIKEQDQMTEQTVVEDGPTLGYSTSGKTYIDQFGRRGTYTNP